MMYSAQMVCLWWVDVRIVFGAGFCGREGVGLGVWVVVVVEELRMILEQGEHLHWGQGRYELWLLTLRPVWPHLIC